MQPFKYNFNIYRSQAMDFSFLWKDGNLNPQNITGYTAQFIIYDNYQCKNVLMNLGVGTGITNGGITGQWALFAADTVVAAIPNSVGVYQFIMTMPNAEKRLLVTGNVQFIG